MFAKWLRPAVAVFVLLGAWETSWGTTFFSDDFESYADDAAVDAAGWKRIDAGGATETATWTITNPGARRNPPTSNGSPSAGKFIISDSDAAGGTTNVTGTGMSHDLWTPSFSTAGAGSVWLHADCVAQLNNGADAIFDVDVSTDGGTTWTNVLRRVSPGRATPPASDITNADGFFGQLDLELSAAAANQADVRIRFRHYEPTDDWFIALDDVRVDDVAPPKAGNCVALANQDFSGGFGAMTVLSIPGNTGTETWHLTDKGGRYVAGAVSGRGVNRINQANPVKEFVILDSDADPDPAEDEYLKTPAINCTTFAEVFLEFQSETVVDDQATQDVLLSLDGGATFPITVFSYNQAGGATNALFDGGEEPFYAQRLFKVPAAAGQPNVVFAFHYKSPGDRWWWALDNIRVTATTGTCNLPPGVFLSENFDNIGSDADLDAFGWQRLEVNGATETATWTITNPGGRRNPPTANGTASTGKFIISDSDAAGGPNNVPGTGMSHDLITPIFSTSGASTVWLHASCVAQLNNGADAIFDVDVSTDGGANWANAFHRVSPGRTTPPASDNSNADGFFGQLNLDLSSVAANQPSVRLRFRHFEPTDDWFIALDDIQVDDDPPVQPGSCVALRSQGFSSGLGAMKAVSRIAPPNSGAETWSTADKGNRYVAGAVSGRGVNRLNHPNPVKEFAILDSDANPDPPEDEYLVTPVLNCAFYSEVFLQFKSETVLHDGATQDVLLSLDGGATFPITIFSYNQADGATNALFDSGEEPFYGEHVFKVNAAAGQPKVVFAFRYKSPGDRWWWALDDIQVTATTDNCDPCNCALRSLSISYDPTANTVTGTWGTIDCEEGFRVMEGGRQIGGDLPADATTFVDTAPPVAGPGVVYKLLPLLGGQVERECPFAAVDTFKCHGGFACRPDQKNKTMRLSWQLGQNTGATGFQIRRNGEIAGTAGAGENSFTDNLPAALLAAKQHLSLNYELVAAGTQACSTLSCRAILSTGAICFADDFEDYADDVALELGGWFRVDVLTTPPGEPGSTWTVTNPGGRRNPPTFDGQPSSGRFAVSDSDFADLDNGAPGNGNSNDLWSPVFSAAGKSAVWLHLDTAAQMNNNGKVVFDVDVSTDGGVNWTNAFRSVAPSRVEADPKASTVNADGFFGRLDLDLTALAANQPQVSFRVRSFEPSDDWWIAIDNVIVDDVAPPQGGKDTLFMEDFSSGLGQMAAVSLAGNSGTATWHATDRCNRAISKSATGFPYLDGRGIHRLGDGFAIVDLDCPPQVVEDELLVTPSINCSNYTEVFLHWKSEVLVNDDAVEEVLFSLDGGTTIQTLFSYNVGAGFDGGEEPFYAARVFKIDEAAGQGNVLFGFHFKSPAADRRFWAVDDIKVTGTPIPPLPPCEVTGVTCNVTASGISVSWSIASGPDCKVDRLEIRNGGGTVLATPDPAATSADLQGACEALAGGPTGTISVISTGPDGTTRQGSCNVECGRDQIPGNANQDAELDIGDPVTLLQVIFLGRGSLPCGDGTASDPGNIKLLDFDGNGSITSADAINDAIAFLTWEFKGGPAHVLGLNCVKIVGCPEVCR